MTSGKKKIPATSGPAGYLHGYSAKEQDRLYKQAKFLEQSVYEKVDFSGLGKIIEVGCGVGAQTEILLRRFPGLFIQGVDASKKQLDRARARLASAIREDRARFDQADALQLPYYDNEFDGAFVCWFLEHVQKPVEILREIRRVLKPSGVIYCTEVMNASFYIHPYSPATLQYGFAFTDHQWSLKGDPFVGGKLANYLLAAGYQNVSTEVKVHHYDNRAPKKRTEYIEDMASLLLSGAPELIQAGKVSPEVVKAMENELKALKDDPDAVFFNTWIQARAQAF